MKNLFHRVIAGFVIGIVAALTIIGGTEFANFASQDSPKPSIAQIERSLQEALKKDAEYVASHPTARYAPAILPAAHAGPFTDYAENKIIDALFRGQALGAPATWGVALYTTCPTDSTAGTEVTNANAYARQGLTANLTNFKSTNGTTGSASTGTTGTTTNAVAIPFPTATGSWGTIQCWGLTDSTTYGGGSLWLYQTVTTPPTITNGSTASFAVDAMSIQVDN